ncbi:hypothetical protein HMPREF1486_05258 [Streptomyces sp. HPH0547]|nr:hypothetical protein HMPREF1486_05258 [Streptomyces sp. HPH0547]
MAALGGLADGEGEGGARRFAAGARDVLSGAPAVVDNRAAMDDTAIGTLIASTTHTKRIGLVRGAADGLLAVIRTIPDHAAGRTVRLRPVNREGQPVPEQSMPWHRLVGWSGTGEYAHSRVYRATRRPRRREAATQGPPRPVAAMRAACRTDRCGAGGGGKEGSLSVGWGMLAGMSVDAVEVAGAGAGESGGIDGALGRIEWALRQSWGADTCSPDDLARAGWSPANPAWGQCDVTALVVHDLLGGELMCGEVYALNGEWQGFHWWNRLPGGREVDLTRDQFREGQVVTEGVSVPRPVGRPLRRSEEYTLLRARVLERLGR